MMPPQDRAGMVYSGGLRRCLIIFAPHTLILDRRTCTCRAPLPPEVFQRSKNFTSSAGIPFTPSSPIEAETAPHPQALGTGEPEEPGGPGRRHQIALEGHQGQHNNRPHQVDALTFHGRASSRSGCFGHTEFSTVTTMAGSGGGQWGMHGAHTVTATRALGMTPLGSPLKETWGRSRSSHHEGRVQEHTAGG